MAKSFEKDFKRCRRRGLKLDKLSNIIGLLENDEALPKRTRPHRLVGNYSGKWECHVEPDWLLIYSLIDHDVLKLERTGTHSDLF